MINKVAYNYAFISLNTVNSIIDSMAKGGLVFDESSEVYAEIEKLRQDSYDVVFNALIGDREVKSTIKSLEISGNKYDFTFEYIEKDGFNFSVDAIWEAIFSAVGDKKKQEDLWEEYNGE